MKPLICNLKMNHLLKDMIFYKKEIETLENTSLIICPSFCYLPLMHSKYYHLGSQDVSVYEMGSHTGEVSASSLKSLDVKAVLIGHFECHDSFEVKMAKLKNVLKQKMNAYVILSDSKEDYDYQYTNLKLLNQIRAYLSRVLKSDYKFITFIYEPEWLIGGKKALPIEGIEKLFKHLKTELYKDYQHEFSFFYGGGLGEDNILEFYSNQNIDGLLLGNYCHNPQNIIKFVQNIK